MSPPLASLLLLLQADSSDVVNSDQKDTTFTATMRQGLRPTEGFSLDAKCPLKILVIGFSSGQEVDCSRPPAGWPQRPPQCCDLPFPLDDMKKSFGSCIRQIARPTSTVPTPKSVRDTRLCLEECVYKGVGFIKEGATDLEKDAIERKLKNAVTNTPSWEKGVTAALETCFDENKSTEVNSEESSCSSSPHDLTHCLLRNLFLNCPADLWNASEECEVVKSRMKDCPDVPPPPPPPPQRFQRPPPF